MPCLFVCSGGNRLIGLIFSTPQHGWISWAYIGYPRASADTVWISIDLKIPQEENKRQSWIEATDMLIEEHLCEDTRQRLEVAPAKILQRCACIWNSGGRQWKANEKQLEQILLLQNTPAKLSPITSEFLRFQRSLAIKEKLEELAQKNQPQASDGENHKPRAPKM